MLASTSKLENGRYAPTVNGKPIVLPDHFQGGFVYEHIAQKLAESYANRNDDGQAPRPKKGGFNMNEGLTPYKPIAPDPSPQPDYSCMGTAGARPKSQRLTVNLLHVEKVERISKVDYEQPDVFDLSTSKGSAPIICCPNDEIDMTPAQVTSIRLVRLIEAQRIYEQSAAYRKVDVNLDPEAEGHYAAMMCHQRKSCPYPANTPERTQWMENFDAYSGVET